LATRLRPEEGLLLPPGDVEDGQELRAELEQRRASRRKQRRFRRAPAAYLTELDQTLLIYNLHYMARAKLKIRTFCNII
jgi:hypothetical protein